MTINIYQGTAATTYTLIYTLDHCNTLDISRNNGAIQFALPIVDNTVETSGRLLTGKVDTISLTGVTSDMKLSFDIPMTAINTCLNLVTNAYNTQFKVDINDWSGQVSGFSLVGTFDSVRIRQEGGDPRLTCELSFLEGTNVMV